MKNLNMSNGKKTARRRGALTMELILIFPIIMLLFILFYQVSVMLLTYHSLQTVAIHAAAVAADTKVTGMNAAASQSANQETNPVNQAVTDAVTEVVKNAVQSWYYGPKDLSTLKPTSKEDWKDASEFSFRILVSSLDSSNQNPQWRYATSDDDWKNAKLVAVEVKLPQLFQKYGNYWLLPQFKGIEAPSQDAANNNFVVSAVAYR